MSRKSSGSDPFATALRLLSLRDHSTAELSEKLRRKGHGEEEIAAVVSRCRDLGYLDDARFARARARRLLSAGKAVGPRVLADLKGCGISSEEARSALDEASCDMPQETVARDLLRRRFPGFVLEGTDDREKRRVISYFLRRGFSLSLVLSILKEER